MATSQPSATVLTDPNPAGRKSYPGVTQLAPVAGAQEEVSKEVPQNVPAATTEAPKSGVSAAATDTKEPEASATQEDVLEIDPNKLIKLPTGETMTYAQLSKSRMTHEEWIRRTSVLDRDKKALAEKQQAMAGVETLADLVKSNQRMNRVASLMLEGKTEDEAFRIVAGNSAQADVPAGPTIVVGSRRIAAAPADITSDEYAEWHEKVYTPAFNAATNEATLNPKIAELEAKIDRLTKAQSQETEREQQLAETLELSSAAVQSWTSYLPHLGIDYTKLDGEQRKQAQVLVGKALVEAGIDPFDNVNLASRVVQAHEVENAVYRAFSIPRNPFLPKAEDKPNLAKPRNEDKAPIAGSRPGAADPSGGSVANRFMSPSEKVMAEFFK